MIRQWSTNDPRMTRRHIASNQLTHLIRDLDGSDAISVGELLARLGGASLPFALLMLSLPALIPLPGPFGIAFGTALSLIGLQIVLGARRLWLPAWISRREVAAHRIQKMLGGTVPWLSWAEGFMRPRRFKSLTGIAARQVLGVPIILLGAIIALPIPLGNVLPVIAIAAFALALLARDGLAVLVAIGISLIAAAWTLILILFGVGITNFLLSFFSF